MERGTALDADFVSVVEAQAPRLVRLAAFLGADDAEDVAQEALCRLYERRGLFEGELGAAGAWLSRTVVNLVRDRARRGRTARQFWFLTRRDAEEHHSSAEALSLASSEGRRLMTALAHLPQRRREAVVLRYWLDLSYADIAQAMGTSVGAAKSAVSRGLTDLHTHLEES